MPNISESLKKQREQLLAEMGEDALSRHTSLLEVAVISLYNRLANLADLKTEEFRSSAAVLARGTLGKGFMDPHTPVQLYLLRDEAFSWKSSWIDEIVSPLQEAGWTVNLRTGSLEQFVTLAQEDFQFLLELMEVRFISGNRQLWDNLDSALSSVLDNRGPQYLETLQNTFYEGWKALDETKIWSEPDLENNPGGLGTITSIRLACRFASRIKRLEDAIFSGYLNREEVDFLQQAEDSFLRLVSLLRTIGGDASPVLSFERQEILAEKLGYAPRAGFLPVEGLMQKVYQAFHGVFFIAQEFWARLLESRSVPGESSGFIQLEEGISVCEGRLFLHTDRYPATPANLVHLFAVAAEHRLQFANVTRQWIQHNRNVLDGASGDHRVKEELLELIVKDDVSLPMVRRFYDQGLLTSLIPELAAVHGLAQHDAFHLYPLHEHHLRVLSELKKLVGGHYSEAEPELTAIANGIGDPVCLYLAGILHDIGKSSGADHALHGGEMVPVIARRLGFNDEESDTLQFLVAQHLLIMDSASMRDLADQQMLAHCALTVGALLRLDLLTVLSWADLRATGPKGAQKWRDTPVLALYDLVGQLLEKGEPSPEALAERIERVKAQVEEELADLISAEELERYFAELSPRYLLSMPPDAITRHLRLSWQLQASSDPFVLEVSDREGIYELTFLSWEMPEWLLRTTGVLTLHDINIIGAQVFTMNNGILLLAFQCRLPKSLSAGFDWGILRNDILGLLQGKMALNYRIAAHAVLPTESNVALRASSSKVLIDNDSSDKYTILEVYALDRGGLLYTVSRTLYELQIRIYVAKITTKVDQVADVFYIRTHEGKKVTDPDQMQEIRKALCFWLDGPVSGF